MKTGLDNNSWKTSSMRHMSTQGSPGHIGVAPHHLNRVKGVGSKGVLTLEQDPLTHVGSDPRVSNLMLPDFISVDPRPLTLETWSTFVII
jgi:hypothetical protein